MERLLEVGQNSDTELDDENSSTPSSTGNFISPSQENIKLAHMTEAVVKQKSPSSIAVTPESKPSSTAMELIKLRDWVLLAQSSSTSLTTEALSEIYKRLGHTLELEDITPLEMTGKFNYDQQQVVDTKVTHDPELEETICSTVRPGYLFDGKLIRPQEVTVYIMID
ncbi:nucleotide exchange factor GrpE [Synechococcus sp. PCC 7335]|uniref:nucleotide exchange factor GrpE n=1 Tax=Synechococcus sp. (strain ATCC 29403 / PCC 7335) TaxID=91464 RepID=UPI000683517F|nr:nucleotide exchange factor GrpE [Synechococcus sp. PCC 7335]